MCRARRKCGKNMLHNARSEAENAGEDLGRVIGRRGVTAQSLRTLLRALGTKNSARYNLKIVNNDNPDESTVISSDDDDANDSPVDNSTTDDVENEETKESDFAKKSRQELAELDDLDI